MDNPGQFLIHVTNRGPAVFSSQTGKVGEFKVSAKQPLKDINKFGLLHYSIPKMCDTVINEIFYFRIVYGDGNYRDIPVRMPNADYYNMVVSQLYNMSGTTLDYSSARIKDRIALDEVLQSTINWAIQEEYNKIHDASNMGQPAGARVSTTWGDVLLNRVSVIVRFNPEGLLEIICGYRGYRAFNNVGALNQSHTQGAPLANTGSPFNSYVMCTPGNIVTSGAAHNDHRLQHPDPAANPPYVSDNNPLGNNWEDGLKIVGCGFAGLSVRMQLVLGASGATEIMNESMGDGGILQARVTRGRIRLYNYQHAGTGNYSGIIRYTGAAPPNLSPPSFMYLQMTVPGTRSKILGMEDERGGWAVPTPPNEYLSRFLNFPLKDARYHPRNIRTMPVVTSQATYDTNFANLYGGNGIGFNFDPIPLGAGGQKVNGVDQMDNYNNVSGSVNLSGILKFTNDVPPLARLPYATDVQGEYNAGFGAGPYRRSAVFTVSLIEPNFIFTSTENSTMQTFDVRLMWGDTSEEVRSIAGNPVQFSIIASP